MAHLDDAARRCDRLGAPLLAARARAERARVLAAARTIPRRRSGDRADGNVFRRDGDVWTVAFGGRTVPLRDAKGLRDLAVLLAAPGREVAATELVAGVPARQPRPRRASAPTRSSTTGPGPPTGPGWPASTTIWPRRTRTTTSSDRPGWPPNVTR